MTKKLALFEELKKLEKLGLDARALRLLLAREPDAYVRKAITFILTADEDGAYETMKKLEASLLKAGKELPDWLRIALHGAANGKRKMEALEDYFAEARNDHNR